MTEETAQDAPADGATTATEAPARTPRRRRAPRQDALLVADVATARAGVEQIAETAQIGPGHRVVVEEDRLVVHLFECTLPGYRGWNWFASLARAPRSKAVTVCEVGLLPGEDALLAPEWVPWSERVSEEEKAREEQERAAEDAEQDAGEDAGQGAPAAGTSAAGDPGAAEERTVPETSSGTRPAGQEGAAPSSGGDRS